ncbi:hypothetical protein WMY93_002132 [Mugilogobius chulae]|uniref:Symplekin/Pta1 N-terminal domain-containing protein n=1 Tax=Mugilogobius chulae TaxID=88201 RepID=A0AAW0PYR7_9GOBI
MNYIEEEEVPQKKATPKNVDMTTSERVVELLNQAALIPTDEKLTVLKQVQELIINKDPSLLDNFLDWLVRSKVISEMQEACWDMLTQMKGEVLELLDSENDGVRTHAIKFTEALIIALSPRTQDSEVPKRQENDISLDKVPKDHSYIRYDTLCEEGKTALEKLLKFMVHPAISSINLTTALGSLATIARQRPMFMSEVVQAYETLHANLPPTLAKSQVSSVRKNLKMHLVAVLKHPCSLEFHGHISTLLQDLGMPQSEIARSTPAVREQRKRSRHEQYTEGKKVKIEPALIDEDEDKEEPAPLSVPKPAPVPTAQSAIDLTAEFLRPLLTPRTSPTWC